MLVIPYQTRFAVRSLPLVTLVLVAVNLLVYLVFQAGDSAAYRRAADFYFGSSLPQIEMPRYAAYLERRNDRKAGQVLRAIRTGPSEDEARMILMAMQHDREFMRDLKGGVVVRSDEAGLCSMARATRSLQRVAGPGVQRALCARARLL